MAGRAVQKEFDDRSASIGSADPPILPHFERRLASAGNKASLTSIAPAIVSRRSIGTLQPVWADVENRQSIYVLEEGLAYSFTFLPGGKRHIDDIYGPGAICNWARFGSPEYKCNIMLKPNSRVAILDPARLQDALKDNLNLLMAIQRHELARTLRISQRVRALISLPAPHRLAIFLLDLREEYHLSGHRESWLPLVFTQEEMADLAGMTEVHVNRTLSKMVDAGELERRPGMYCLPNADRLERQLGYRRFGKGHSDASHA